MKALAKSLTRLNDPLNPPEVTKLSALLKLRKALLEERYEECPKYISIAQKFGAEAGEIKRFLKNPRHPFED